jgi:hypothetical protein
MLGVAALGIEDDRITQFNASPMTEAAGVCGNTML